MLNGKIMVILFNSWIDKKGIVSISDKYFPSYIAAKKESAGVTLNLNNYVTQKEFKNLTGNVDTSDFALKTNVAEIKSRVDDIDVNKIDYILC